MKERKQAKVRWNQIETLFEINTKHNLTKREKKRKIHNLDNKDYLLLLLLLLLCFKIEFNWKINYIDIKKQQENPTNIVKNQA